ncbi:hypothetical protein [Crenothrix sp.]|uniref:hypothetical protein n=1 Tax=Crenothrix sp. TaxID=3100433 RepID=UPI00374DCFBB
MKKIIKEALGVALLGIDDRSRKLLTMFFKGPCEGFAKVVEEDEASVDIIDIHFAHSEQLVQNSLTRIPKRAIIVLTSQAITRIDADNLLYLNKPIKADEMMEAIDWASDIAQGKIRQKPFFDPVSVVANTAQLATITPNQTAPLPVMKTNVSGNAERRARLPALLVSDAKIHQKNQLTPEEYQKKIKYLAAVSGDEKKFSDFIGLVAGFKLTKLNDINERHQASYEAKNYYQGHLQSAYRLSLIEKQNLQLTTSIWTPLIILPLSQEIYGDASDQFLREITDIQIDSNAVQIAPANKDSMLQMDDLEKIHEIDAFLWKLALWTSKGRYPNTIDVDKPVYLNQWPDFTRLIVTPHALQIAGLLINGGPDTMPNIASQLKIDLCYVYAFMSAAHALHIAGQARRQEDTLIKTTLPLTEPVQDSLFNQTLDRIIERLNRLRR